MRDDAELARPFERFGARRSARDMSTRQELLALYRDAAVVAVPSRYEGFGCCDAAAQALCAGVPCVVSDRTSLPEVVGDGAGIAAIDDLHGWTEMLDAALRGDWDERASRARDNAISSLCMGSQARSELLAASTRRLYAPPEML